MENYGENDDFMKIEDYVTVVDDTYSSSYDYYGPHYYNSSLASPLASHARILWSLLAGTIMLLAATGNLIVIWIVVANPRMRTVTNYFLLNLAVSDSLTSTLSMPFIYSYLATDHFRMGMAMCKLSFFFGNVSSCSSILSLVAITLDRYRAIIHPFMPRLTKTVVGSMMVFVWTASCLIASPYLFYNKLVTFVFTNRVKIRCSPFWPDGGIESKYGFWYNILRILFVYLVPLSIMAVCYSIMGVKLWGNDVIGEQVQNRSRQIKAKRKVVKMIVVVTITFAVCWLPLHVYNLLGIIYPNSHMQPYSLNLYLAIWCLAMTSSMYNPIIYCWMNDRFRDGFKKVFRCMKPTIDSKPDHFRGGITATSGPPTSTTCQLNSCHKSCNDHRTPTTPPSVVISTVTTYVDDTTC